MSSEKVEKTAAVAGGEESAAAEKLKVLYATSELAPYAYTGGLGDVSASLPPRLGRLGAEMRVVLP